MPNILEDDLKNLNLSFHKLITWFLDDRSLCLELDGDHRAYELATHLSRNFKVCSNFEINEKKEIRYVPKIFKKEEFLKIKDVVYRNLIIEIYNYVNEYLSDYIINFIIHGSLASFDFSKGWSDVDTFVVIKNSTLASPEKLYNFRKYCLQLKSLFYKLCPLQHHGLIIFSENDLNNYSSNFIPHQVLNSSIEFLKISKELRLKININNKTSEELLTVIRLRNLKNQIKESISSGKLCHHPYKRECLENNYKNSHNAMHQIFWLSGNIMTIPAYLLTSIGKPCEKKYSFEKTENLFSKESQDLINKVSNIRSKWEDIEGINYKGNAIPIWFQEILGESYFERFYNLLEDTIQIIEKENSDL